MDSFLRHTARAIMEQTDWRQLRNMTIVLPSQRAGVVLEEEMMRLQQENHAQAVWAPTVLTLPKLQDYLSPLYAEDEFFSIVRLYKLYRLTFNLQPLTDPMPLDLFYGWGRQMLEDFTNIDASMHAEEVPNFFANTIAAHELEQWQLDEETEQRLKALMSGGQVAVSGDKNSIRAQYEQIWKQLYELYQGLHAQMLAEQKGYTGMRQRAVIEHWNDESIQTKIAGRTFVFVGFNYLLPVERELMLLLRDAGQARFYWDYIPDFQTNEKAFSFAKQNAEILGNNGERLAVNGDPKPVTMIECVSREAQAQYVHRWLQENYTAPGQRVGVVICDETMLEPVIYTLPAITLPGQDAPAPINITKGFPLRNTAVYARVLAWINDPARGKADDIVTPDILDALLKNLESPESQENPESPTQALKWQELLILESEYQVRKIINQLRLLLTQGIGDIPFTLKLLRLLLRRMMESCSMPFHGEPVTDIQVMGVLETRVLDFDKLLILNVEEGVIPQHKPDISFIPFYLRKAYHMQTSDERATVYAYNFFRLLNRAGHATLLYASAETSEGGKGMSRFLLQILYSPEFIVEKRTLQEASILQQNVTMEPTNTSLLSTLTKDEEGILRKADGKRYRMSPSALNTYISCPRSFYLQYILGLQPQEDEEVLFAPNTMGTFVHLMMEYLYRTYLHCTGDEPTPVTPDDIEAIRTNEALLQEALMAAYEQMPEYNPAHHVGENVIIIGYVQNILARDREDAKTGLQIYLLEQDRNFTIRIDGIGELFSGGKIDRLDIYGAPGEQRLRIIDYKSGNYNDTIHAKRMSAKWEDLMESEDKGYVRQTLMYCHAVQVHDRTGLPIEPNLYFCRRKLTDIDTTISIEEQTVSDYKTIRQPFYEHLCTKIKEVLTATTFPPCEEEDCPTFCPFFDLCGRKKKELQ